MTPRTSSATWVRGLLDMFAQQGVPTPALLDRAGIDAARVADPGSRFDADEVSTLWRHAIAMSGNLLLGMDRDLAARHVNFDMVGFASLSSDNLGEALQALARYLDVISSATVFRIEPAAQGAWLVMGHTGHREPLPPQRSAYSLLALLTLCRWVTRRDALVPLAVQFDFQPPGDAGVFERAFGAAVRFGAADHRLLLAADELALPLPARHPGLLALHQQALDERLAALGDARVSARVSEIILTRLDQGEPRREVIAKALALSDRTLQRRLREEGTSFQQLLDDVRRSLAVRYLSDARQALGEVAWRLGFADQSNFFRACRRWFGVPPGQVRANLLRERGSAG